MRIMDTKTLRPNAKRIARSLEIYRDVIALLERGPASRADVCAAIGLAADGRITDYMLSIRERMAVNRHPMVIAESMSGGFITYQLKPRARRTP